jgi:hypothetical protein
VGVSLVGDQVFDAAHRNLVVHHVNEALVEKVFSLSLML